MDPTFTDPNAMAGIMGALAGVAIFVGLIAIGVYVYMAFAMMKTAQRLGTPNAWLAWIPIGNMVLMANMAKMHWWPVLLILIAWIPIIGWIAGLVLAVFAIIWQWKICEARNKPGWWAILLIIPLVGNIWGLVMWGILAWSKQ
ncbi:MAG: hypothetical protein ACLFP2_00095 [Candidatus Woesearchaeota archaeon]